MRRWRIFHFTEKLLHYLAVGYKSSKNTEYFSGNIAEVIVYSDPLNTAQTKIVEEYLASKYNLSAYSGSIYSGDTPVNGDYDTDVAGIGRESDGSNTAASSAGLLVTDAGYLTDDGDYFMFGHKVAANSTTIDDIPAGVDQRWERVWYFNKLDTNVTGGSLSLTFDFSDGGFAATPSTNPGDYTLLSRTGTSGTFSPVINATSISVIGLHLVLTP